jgi:hypothetical protein
MDVHLETFFRDKSISISSILSASVFLAEKVALRTDLKGKEKLELVVSTLKEFVKDSAEYSALVERVIPGMLDLVISTARGKFQLKTPQACLHSLGSYLPSLSAYLPMIRSAASRLFSFLPPVPSCMSSDTIHVREVNESVAPEPVTVEPVAVELIVEPVAVEPVEPVAVEPVEPVEPVAVAPVAPVAVAPVEPVATAEPVTPAAVATAEPVAPAAVATAEPVAPAAVEPVAPVEPVEPAAVEPVAPVEPAAVEPVAVEPVAPVEPVILNDPVIMPPTSYFKEYMRP